MDTKITPIQPKTSFDKAGQESERIRNTLFSTRPLKKGKITPADEALEKARRQAQDEYMDRLDKQFIQR